MPDYSKLKLKLKSRKTNRDYHGINKAPIPQERFMAMTYLENIPKMVSIEPIMDFDLDVMMRWIEEIKPEFVSIGADSKGHNLPEPPPDKVKELIQGLKCFTIVKVKNNLNRILKYK